MSAIRTASVTITAEQRTNMLVYWELYERVHEEITATTRKRAFDIPDFVPVMRAITPAQLEQSDRESRESVRRAIVDGEWAVWTARTRQEGARYATMGVGFTAWFELVTAFRGDMIDLIERELAGDADRRLRAIKGLDRYVDLALGAIGEGYLEAKQSIIEKQQSAIRELSTPVLQIVDRLVILPVVGMVDTERARQLTESLLQAVRDRRARVVIMDITGVPIVDSKVANHLVQTVDAARLMGADVIVTGISPEIAQTLVTIGADLDGVQTLGDLQGGFDEAARRLGLRLVPVATGATVRA